MEKISICSKTDLGNQFVYISCGVISHLTSGKSVPPVLKNQNLTFFLAKGYKKIISVEGSQFSDQA